MQDAIGSFLNSIDFQTNLVFAIVSSIIGILLYIIDRRGNKRQEEALDIILDQVSKVNQFQTRSLVLAIDTLENELNDIKQTVINNREILTRGNSSGKPSIETIKPPQSEEPGLSEVFSKKFSQVISDQVNNLMSGIQNDLKDLQTSTVKEETYKKKKGLEFDVKSLLRNLEGLGDLHIDTNVSKKPRIKVEGKSSKLEEDYVIEPEIVNEIENLKETRNVKEKFEKFEEKMEKIKSIGDLENIVNSLSDMFAPEEKKTSKKRKNKN